MRRREVPERTSPSAWGRKLGEELRKLREAAGLTGDAVAARLGWSGAKVSRLEKAKSSVAIPDLRKLLALYGAPSAQAERLERMADAARERGWWEFYADDLPAGYRTYIELEADASSVTYYSAVMLPGLLQTENYARAVMQSIVMLPRGEVERRVQVRRTRQGRLHRTDAPPLKLVAILDESVLRRQVGGTDVMRDQLKYLVDLACLPNVAIQVLPFSAGAHAAASGPFMVLTVSDQDVETVHVELMGGGVLVDDENEVYQYNEVIRSLRAAALNMDKSIEFINEIITDLSECR
jgi:transcriptional regulator with XRE-family HTH domain